MDQGYGNPLQGTKGHKLTLFARESSDPTRGAGYMKKMVVDGEETTLDDDVIFLERMHNA